MADYWTFCASSVPLYGRFEGIKRVDGTLAFIDTLPDPLEPITGIKVGYYVLLLPTFLFLVMLLAALVLNSWASPRMAALLKEPKANGFVHVLQLIFTTIAGMSANAPGYKAIFEGNVELSDLCFLCSVVFFGFLTGWLAIVEQRTQSETAVERSAERMELNRVRHELTDFVLERDHLRSELTEEKQKAREVTSIIDQQNVRIEQMRRNERGHVQVCERYREQLSQLDAKLKASFLHVWIGQTFLRVVGFKHDRLRNELDQVYFDSAHQEPRQPNSRGRYKRVCDALSPTDQVQFLLSIAHHVLFTLLRQKHAELAPKLRVAYFAANDSQLSPTFSFNGTHTNCVQGPNRNGCHGRFEIRRENGLRDDPGSAAVAAAYSGEILLIPDTLEAHKSTSSPFCFSSDEQGGYLCSAAIIPLGPKDRDGIFSPLLCVDTDCRGFFGDDLRDVLKVLQCELQPRLLCEKTIQDFIQAGREPE